jgi:hypothetical protein
MANGTIRASLLKYPQGGTLPAQMFLVAYAESVLLRATTSNRGAR